MERWILHYDRAYDAVPWPYSRPWDSFVAEPEPLVLPCDDLGRASPCDGLSEMPSVPANLPRACPQGRYRLAVYHDAEHLYVFLEAEDGPQAVTDQELRRAPQLAEIHTPFAALVIFSPDSRRYFHIALDGRGRPNARIQDTVHGPRARKPEDPLPRWDFRLIRRPGGDLSCWRIARPDLAPWMTGNTLRLAVSRMALHTLESVAWGSQTNWAPRFDEMGEVRLVDQPPALPWPRVRRVEFLYDPAAERGRFRVLWRSPYTPQEAQPSDRFGQLLEDWHRCAFRFNGLRAMAPLADAVESPDFPIPDGFNRLQVTSCGGPELTVDFEKRSGNRIVDAPLPPATAPETHENRCSAEPCVAQASACGRSPEDPLHPHSCPPWSCATDTFIRDRIHAEGQTLIRELDQRRATGEQVGYRRTAPYHAMAAGRAVHYLNEDPRLLEVLRDEADRTLAMQRPDGTFSGFHLQRHGVSPGLWTGGAYDTGPVGELWVVAAWLLGDEKYLAAATRLLRAYATYPVEFNHNYAAFALYHLSAHYRLTRDPEAIERGLHYARHCVAVDLLPLGYQSGHNYYSVYGAITLRGMAHFCSILPADHPYRPTLRELCLRMANQLISRQQPDGCFDARDRFFIGRSLWLGGLLSVAFILDPDDVARLDRVLQRMLHCPPDRWDNHPHDPYARLCESDFIRYLVHRPRLLAGRPLDLNDLR